jgi:hypothetical protein
MAKKQIYIELGILVVVLTIGALCVYTINKNGVPGYGKRTKCDAYCLAQPGSPMSGKPSGVVPDCGCKSPPEPESESLKLLKK